MDNDRGQSLITKYVWMIETIYHRRKISFKELNELWLRDDISRGVDIPKRTFDNWRYVIWDMFGINIVHRERGGHQQEWTSFLALQYFLREQRLGKQPEHQRPYYSGICSFRAKLLAAYHRGYEGKPCAKHDLSQLLEG